MSTKRIAYLLLDILLCVGLFFSCAKKSDSTIRLGATFSLTGENASYGRDAQEGISLALDEINVKGGVSGKKIEVIFEDNRSDPKLGINIIKKFVEVDKVPLVLGADASSVTLAMAPYANQTKTILISPISSSPLISGAGEFVFRTCPSDAFQSVVMAEWLITGFNYKTAGVLYVNNAWGTGLKDTFVKEFEARGGKVIGVESCNEDDNDFRTQLVNLKKAKAEALFVPTYSKAGARILKQSKELHIDIPLFGGDVWGAPELIEGAGDAANGIRFTVPDKFQGNEYQEFAKKYQAKYGKEPDFNATSAYDLMNIVAQTIQTVLSKSESLTGDSFRKALQDIKDYQGATGTTTFDENGDVIGKPFTRKIILDGKVQEDTGQSSVAK